MPFTEDLQAALEREELETAGNAFGGSRRATHKNFSVASIRDLVLSQASFGTGTEIERTLREAAESQSPRLLRFVVGSLIRFSFLIELTNLKVGSTKMKTRWLPVRILMPQPGSFEPVQGTFQPGSDPRAATFEDCVKVFATACRLFLEHVDEEQDQPAILASLNSIHRVPYEFPLSYADANQEPVHIPSNVKWALTDDLRWLLRARPLLRNAQAPTDATLRQIEKKKLEVKVFKTDRALTGKDKTNRAKRWEVLVGDFQHATLEQCWSAERKLTTDLVCFLDFPPELKSEFVATNLVSDEAPVTCCPVTLEPLSFPHLAAAVVDSRHGISDYQVGHLHPLKKGGMHDGENVCWQSADGNRIQGDLSIEQTKALLDAIATRRAEVH